MVFAPNYEKIKHFAKNLRIEILKMTHQAGSGHTGGSLGMTDVFSTLYFSGILNFNPENPKWDDRDRVILSNAHINPLYYAVLSYAGYFPESELLTLRKFGSKLQGHPNNHFPDLGIETSGGPLGQGMSVAVGISLALNLKQKKDSHVFCFCSDGELNEGQSWEAIMSAAKFKLSNLTFIIDRNNIQIDGKSDDVMPLEPLQEKLKSFGLDVLDVDGHDYHKIYNAFKYAKEKKSAKNARPVALIMHTILGKGVSFMENNSLWHGKAPNDDEFSKALEEINN